MEHREKMQDKTGWRSNGCDIHILAKGRRKKGWTRTNVTWQEYQQQGSVKFQSSLSEIPLDMMLLSLIIVEITSFYRGLFFLSRGSIVFLLLHKKFETKKKRLKKKKGTKCFCMLSPSLPSLPRLSSFLPFLDDFSVDTEVGAQEHLLFYKTLKSGVCTIRAALLEEGRRKFNQESIVFRDRFSS